MDSLSNIQPPLGPGYELAIPCTGDRNKARIGRLRAW